MLRDISLEVAEGEYVSLVGPSGSGKTTLLSLIGGLDHPQSGQILVGGHDLRTLSGDGLAAFRRETVGFVFQHFGLLEALTARENVELALTLAGVSSARQRHHRASGLLHRVGLGDRLEHRPTELSGGERQRVAIARAIANSPRVILADEPTGDLDDNTAADVGDLLEQLREEEGCTLVVVTHHRRLAARAERSLTLEAGDLIETRGGER
ncbi:MAG TPA: ABC transporter ATP-binding protein [Acidimicrobiales bacterium]|nr:ABC transporter ATP-binding protein [Acidimicrobiales bacterium]